MDKRNLNSRESLAQIVMRINPDRDACQKKNAAVRIMVAGKAYVWRAEAMRLYPDDAKKRAWFVLRAAYKFKKDMLKSTMRVGAE